MPGNQSDRTDRTDPFFLETDRVVLRRFTPADVDNLTDLNSDPEVMRFITGGTPIPRDEIEHDVLPRFLRSYERAGGFGTWAAIDKAGGEFLGWFAFHPADGAGLEEVELGYRLRKAVWGKGYGTEVARALVRKGFTELGVRRVVATADRVNYGSRRVMEKAGLIHVRTFRFADPWPHLPEGPEQDGVDYALSKAEWEQREDTREQRPGSSREDPGRCSDPFAGAGD
ncbi:MAG TPA: GNAT family N-acetyltransferase [Chloroflexota bacterium]|nr:GNAT family N-acetyltransferase [Chloroflexota bacterium]